ncbi:MAG TPA: amylo-alpha-1,6-glucosidase [Pyrinomonadaceae bacterium]|jgi:predicted glycogen debranching enzyme
MISFDEAACRDLDAATRREWLETNGLGGYASTTITGANTRRYHGLLVAATRPPTERAVLLAKLEDKLTVGDEACELATNYYERGTVHPHGYLALTGFRLDPFPVATYRVGAYTLEKSVFMCHGENTTVVRYRLDAPADVRAKLEVRPLVAMRNYHWLMHEDANAYGSVELEPGLLRVARRDDPVTLYLAHDAQHIFVDKLWYRQFVLLEERARGFDYQEDLFNPGLLVLELRGGETRSLVASTEARNVADAARYEEQERARRRGVGEKYADRGEYVQQLVAAADQFVVRRGRDLRTVIAGYPWFTDWGRDTMLSLPGLALALERFDVAREILLAFVAYLNQGLLPNRFPDTDAPPEYNTVDGTLWFVHAVGELLRRTDDEQFVREHFYEALRDIVTWHEQGTHYSIRMTEDGLLRAGEPGVQLTWMDAKVGDYVVTPRAGKPVEIQALWYNALRTVEGIARRLGDGQTCEHCRAVADGARASFNGLFWDEQTGGLYDTVADDGTPDAAIRPNQIFAVSLPHALVTGARARRIVELVRRELLTPYGLRTLAPSSPDYRPRYEGDAYARDTAYHQGTVWPWLLGPFITAYLRTNDRTEETLRTARGWTEGFRAHLREAGLGQVSEIFDAEPPHTPRGCIAQAWSVAELLRCELNELA